MIFGWLRMTMTAPLLSNKAEANGPAIKHTTISNRYDSRNSTLDPADCHPSRELPVWAILQIPTFGNPIWVREWDNDESIENEDCSGSSEDMKGDDDIDGYRNKNGWKGKDLCHSIHSPVRVSHYGVQYKEGGVGTILTGICHFTSAAESHMGHCHGGSMTTVMDDVIGWTAFCSKKEPMPWSGFTAQVNVSLQRPIVVDSYLKIEGIVTLIEGRKVWIKATLITVGEGEGEGEDIVHCTADGLVILKREGTLLTNDI